MYKPEDIFDNESYKNCWHVKDLPIKINID